MSMVASASVAVTVAVFSLSLLTVVAAARRLKCAAAIRATGIAAAKRRDDARTNAGRR